MDGSTNIFIRIIKNEFHVLRSRSVFNTDNKHDFFIFRKEIDFQ